MKWGMTSAIKLYCRQSNIKLNREMNINDVKIYRFFFLTSDEAKMYLRYLSFTKKEFLPSSQCRLSQK